jgi:hypothetical protein
VCHLRSEVFQTAHTLDRIPKRWTVMAGSLANRGGFADVPVNVTRDN